MPVSDAHAFLITMPGAEAADAAAAAPLPAANPYQRPAAVQRVAVRSRRSLIRRVLAARAALPRLWALAMVTGFLAAGAIEPVPDGPDPVVPAWIAAIGDVTLLILLVAVVLLLAGQRAGYGLSTYGSAGLVLLAALCPATGHHVLAPWWFGQLAITMGLLAGSLALRSRAARSPAL
ncbi:hypothetical protein [Frankia sp. CiP3]|uniref:hypothetical protein n=1 Tax=Frankia sp. CiP3 TaxID=2880971 RepID=UPI001EF4FE26|nr:hypothetical protein [Frankia sp. CiP3]